MALRLLVVFLLLAVPLELPACGPFFPEALFALKLQPERAEAEFLRGQLGVVLPTYARFYLVLAYRYFTGAGLNDGERKALTPPPAVTPDTFDDHKPAAWLEARNRVPGVKPMESIDPFHNSREPNTYESFLNCGDDAFRTAVRTLADRIRQFGAASAEVKEWVAAQDAVFTNCSSGPSVPAPTAKPKLRADRAYQIAAAKFYAGQFDAAHADFESIAQDAQSPWRESAPYLAARCAIRAGRLNDAAAELKRIAADPALAHWHAPAERLLEYVSAKTDPDGRVRNLGLKLVRTGSEDSIAHELTDYRFLMDKATAQSAHTDDLTDWIVTFQGGDRNHALEMWRAHRSIPWLVAALEYTNASDRDAAELVDAARAVKPDSPAYLTVRFHAVRLMPADAARSALDELLKLQAPTSARNLFRAQRMRLATSLQEFLRYAPRTLVGETDVEERPDPKTDRYLDSDAAAIFNRQLPLALLKQAAASPQRPPNVRGELATVVYVRSVMMQPQPRFDDIYRIQKSPGMREHVNSGFQRSEGMAQIDDYRDNWWCAIKEQSPAAPADGDEPPTMLKEVYRGSAPEATFLSPAEREQARQEATELSAVPTGPNWLAAQAAQWAEKIPSDPRVPEALHLAVRATRFGCTDKNTGEFSKRAFDLLRQRYPKSPWTAQTRYWYAGDR
jgi:hypothetical protein